MGYAEGISLPEVRARKQWEALRQQLHERFDRWLDEVEAQLPASEPTLAQVCETIWALRQQLTGGVAQTIVAHTHQEEQRRKSLQCATCEHLLRARSVVSRTVETLIGDIEVQRPYFSCRHCHRGRYPLDEVLDLRAGRLQLDVQQAAADLVTELPYDTASTLLGRLSGLAVSSERMHTLTNQAAEGLTVLDVAPSRAEIDQRVAELAASRWMDSRADVRAVVSIAVSSSLIVRTPLGFHRIPALEFQAAIMASATQRSLYQAQAAQSRRHTAR